MTKLKLGPLEDHKPVKLTIELSAAVFRNLRIYADVLAHASGTSAPIEPSKLIVPMIERFMATDHAFAKARRAAKAQPGSGADDRSG